MKEIVKDLLLDNQQIKALIESLDASLGGFNVQGQDLVRLKLSIEDVLLSFQECFGIEKKAKMTIRSRLGSASLILSVVGEPFNPILAEQEEDEGFEQPIQGILFNIGLSTEYQYKQNKNIVIFPLPKKEINSAWFLVIALVGAVIFGVVGNRLSLCVREAANYVLTMFYDIIFGLIGMFAAPMVFFTMIIGVCEIGDIRKLKIFGKKVISGFIFPYAVGLCFCAALPLLFSLNFGEASASDSALESITKAISGIFPTDFISPFANGDFAQIVVTAILLGIGTLILAQEVPAVLNFIVQLNRIISMILDYLCMLIPIVIFITVVKIIWSGEMLVIASAWKPILFSILWLIVLTAWQTISCGKAIGEKPLTVLKKSAPLIITAMSTASTSACYSMMDRVANEELKSDKKLSGFALPIGMMANGAGEFVEFLTLAVYFGCTTGIEVTPAWLLLAVILSFIFSFAVPPVAGGPVVVLSIMLALLNVPTSYIGVAGAVALLMDYPCTAIHVSGIVFVTARLSGKQRKSEET